MTRLLADVRLRIRNDPRWRDQPLTCNHETARAVANVAGCRCTVYTTRNGATTATVEKRHAWGHFDPIASGKWPTDDDSSVIAAMIWCIRTARSQGKAYALGHVVDAEADIR